MNLALFRGTHQSYLCVPKTYILSICGADKPTAFPNGRAVQVDPMKSNLKAPRTKCLKL